MIRNPIYRCISSYLYLLRLEDNGFPDQHPVHITKETAFYKNKDEPIESFNQFLDYINENGFYDAVTLPQVDFLSDRGLTFDDINFVFKQDGIKSLSEQVQVFLNKYNINSWLPKDNEGDYKSKDKLIDSLTDDKKKRILDLYQNDWKTWKVYE